MVSLENQDPFELFAEWLEDATASEPNDPSSVALATISEDGWPSVRMVLLRGQDSSSVHFFTNYDSRKGKELDTIPKAALCFHWKSIRRQVRMVGKVERLDEALSDKYFATRSYGSQIAAWASAQSEVLTSQEELKNKVKEMKATYPQNPPRPPFWGGYRLTPHEIEFWLNGEDRLHERFRFLLEGKTWQSERLYP